MKFVLSEAAARDLEAIHDYTFDNWGADQAVRYVASFQALFDHLVAKPRQGIRSSTSRYRRVRHQSHYVYYELIEGELRIERILHGRMDAARHLR